MMGNTKHSSRQDSLLLLLLLLLEAILRLSSQDSADLTNRILLEKTKYKGNPEVGVTNVRGQCPSNAPHKIKRKIICF